MDLELLKTKYKYLKTLISYNVLALLGWAFPIISYCFMMLNTDHNEIFTLQNKSLFLLYLMVSDVVFALIIYLFEKDKDRSVIFKESFVKSNVVTILQILGIIIFLICFVFWFLALIATLV